MKKLTQLAFLFLLSFSQVSFGQITPNKNTDFLRNYKAPDFKQKRFDIRLNGDGNSSSYSGTNPIYRYNNLTSLTYTQYSNTQRYQGFLTTRISDNITGANTSGSDNFNLLAQLDLTSKNYFYVRPKFFIGAHAASFYTYTINRIDKNFDFQQNALYFSSAVSAGFGRLEPVQYARNAMDMERSLTKGGRLSSPYSMEELTLLSDEITRINNVRFYDFRLRRIEQFEALDKTMQRLGHVSDFDMAYFSYLADAYLYAQSFARFSGFRHEFGLAETANWSRQRGQLTGIITAADARTSLFYRASMQIPASYAVQHELEVLANVAYEYFPNMPVSPGEIGGYASTRYTLGFYPTTRTNINVGAQAGTSIVNVAGYSAGLFANATFYISPQFRISGNLSGSYAANYSFNPYTGIWNEFSPMIVNGYNLWGTIALNYAIF